MTKLSKVKAQKYLQALLTIKKKYVRIYDLSQKTGTKEAVIREDLAFFDPMIRMEEGYDVRSLQTKLTKYGATPKKTAKAKEKLPKLGDFIYEKMTLPGGIIDSNMNLSTKDLKMLKKIVNETLKGMKK
jgi:hypothetical protein